MARAITVSLPPSEPPAEVRYAATQGLRIREFEDDGVVFEPVSWEAHLLNPAALAVLELLLEAPRSKSEVAVFLNDALSPDERSRADEHAHRLLAELRSLGLVKIIEGSERAAG